MGLAAERSVALLFFILLVIECSVVLRRAYTTPGAGASAFVGSEAGVGIRQDGASFRGAHGTRGELGRAREELHKRIHVTGTSVEDEKQRVL